MASQILALLSWSMAGSKITWLILLSSHLLQCSTSCRTQLVTSLATSIMTPTLQYVFLCLQMQDFLPRPTGKNIASFSSGYGCTLALLDFFSHHKGYRNTSWAEQASLTDFTTLIRPCACLLRGLKTQATVKNAGSKTYGKDSPVLQAAVLKHSDLCSFDHYLVQQAFLDNALLVRAEVR